MHKQLLIDTVCAFRIFGRLLTWIDKLSLHKLYIEMAYPIIKWVLINPFWAENSIIKDYVQNGLGLEGIELLRIFLCK